MEEDKFSLTHPVTHKILDDDIFIHGTSFENFKKIRKKGLRRNGVSRNWGKSKKAIYFEMLSNDESYRQIAINSIINTYCKVACEKVKCPQGIIIQINGKELKELGCPIYLDWNYGLQYEYDNKHNPIDVNFNFPLKTIMILDCDIPYKKLKVFKNVTFDDLE